MAAIELADNTRAMAGTLYDLLPPAEAADSDELLGRFLDYVAGKGLTLYPAQEEAILELFEGKTSALGKNDPPLLVRTDPSITLGARQAPAPRFPLHP